MAVKERSQIKGTDAQIKAFAGHNGVLAFATDTKSLHVLSGTAGTTTEFLPSTKVATKAELGSYATTASLSTVATSGSYNDLSDKPVVDSALSSTSENPVQNKVVKSALDGKLSLSGGTFNVGATLGNSEGTFNLVVGNNQGTIMSAGSNYAEGARLTLRAQTLSGDPGAFELVANNGTTSNTLRGVPDGSLTWGGASVWCGNAKWANRTNLTIGQSFTAPSRGFVYSRGYSDQSSVGALITFVNGIALLGASGLYTETGGTVYVNAGDTVIVSIENNATAVSAIFVPIQ